MKNDTTIQHTPTPWFIGMRGGHNANGIYARDGEAQTESAENAKYFDTNICSVSQIGLHRGVEEVRKSERDAVGLANAELIVRAVNSHAALVKELTDLSERMWQRDYCERAKHDSSETGAKDFANSRPWYISVRAALKAATE